MQKTRMNKRKPIRRRGAGRAVQKNRARSRSSYDALRFDEEDLLELDEEEEFLREDADLIEDEEEDEEAAEEPIEDLAETLDADTWDRSGSDESLTDEPEQAVEADESAEEEDLLTDEEVRDFTQEFEKIPEDIADLEAGESAPEEYDAYGEEEDEDVDEEADEWDDAGAAGREGGGSPRRTKRRRAGRRRAGFPHIRLTMFEWVAVAMSVLLVITAVSLGLMFVRMQKKNARIAAFQEIGADLQGLRIIGESGLIAMRDAAALRLAQGSMEEIAEEPKEEEPIQETETAEEAIEVSMTLTTIKSDLKIKFTNAATGKLIANVPFSVTAKAPDGKEDTWTDDDMDGVIYRTGISAGTWSVAMQETDAPYSGRYAVNTKPKTVSVKDTIEYKKVDVSDEIKKESQVNVAVEDTEPKDAAVVESENTDTVEWVESSREEVDTGDGTYGYSEISKDSIEAPAVSARLTIDRRLGRAINGDEQLALTPTALSLTVGETGRITPVPSDFAGEPVCSYESSDSAVAAISDDGTVTAVSAGTATITVTAAATVTVTGEDGVTEEKSELAVAACAVTVKEAEKKEDKEPETVTIGKKTLTLEVGASERLTASSTGFSDPKYLYASADESVASVSADGTVTGVRAGTTSVTVKVSGSDDVSDSCTVKVTEKLLDETTERKLSVSPSTLLLLTGSSASLTVKSKGLGEKEYVFLSSDEEVASVSVDGTVRGRKAGKATITVVAAEDSGVWTTCEVTVSDGGSLKTKSGETVYIKSGDTYREAVAADYYVDGMVFYLRSSAKTYIYHGWQTLDGYTYYFDKNGNFVTGDQTILGVQYHFSNEGILASGSGTLGVDVSKWNGKIDWNAVKNSGVSYAIIRCGYRGTSTGVLVEDSNFRSNMQGALGAGLKVGVYFFSAAVNDVEAVEEASMAASLCSGYRLTYPVFLDVERSDSGNGRADRISTADRTAVVRAFCATMANSGYKAGLYANKDWMEGMIDTPSLTGYKLWLAQYAAAPTYTRTRYDLWQYTSKGTIGGISGKVDLNVSYLNY